MVAVALHPVSPPLSSDGTRAAVFDRLGFGWPAAGEALAGHWIWSTSVEADGHGAPLKRHGFVEVGAVTSYRVDLVAWCVTQPPLHVFIEGPQGILHDAEVAALHRIYYFVVK